MAPSRNNTGGGRGRGRGGRGGGRGGGGGPPRTSSNSRVDPKDLRAVAEQAARKRLYSETTEDHCVVCLNRAHIFAVGRCNHTICNECSTRLRILCDQKECPICRQDMPKVIHMAKKRRYEEVENEPYEIDKKYQICFENATVKKAFKRLLQHRCPECFITNEKTGEVEEKIFVQFKQLDSHVRREHELFYCDICVEHLKIFTHERKIYSRANLALHRRKGDPDDTSHKGHPMCEFCNARFLDNDELFRHLRRDHFFCHFCDADGSQVYYENYPELQDHFREDHFLCEEGSCKDEKFTSAFRSEIDLKAHISDRHSGVMSKAAAKQNRTVELDFNYTRPGQHSQVSRRRGRDAVDDGDPSMLAMAINNSNRRQQQEPTRAPDLAADFPTLMGAAAELAPPPPRNANSSNDGANEYPSLGAASKLAMSTGRNVASNGAIPKWRSGNKGGLTNPDFLNQHFPSLGGEGGGGPPGSSGTAPAKPGPVHTVNYQNIASGGAAHRDPSALQLAPGGGQPKGRGAAGPKAPSTPAEDFPSLAPSKPGLSQFRAAVTGTNSYRYPKGHQPAWAQDSKSGNGGGGTGQPGGMTALSKSGKQPAPAPVIDTSAVTDYPSLGAPAKTIKQVPSKTSKKSKSKKKGDGFLTLEDEPSPKQSGGGSLLDAVSSLNSAADLIPDTPSSVVKQQKDKKLVSDISKKVATSQSVDNFDFPALGAITKGSASSKGSKIKDATQVEVAPPQQPAKPPPPGFSKPPPPGFAAASAPTKSASAPPPGFGSQVGANFDFPALGLTTKSTSKSSKSKEVTTGSGKNSSKVTTTNNNNVARVTYIRPKQFGPRNTSLLEKVTELMGGAESTKFNDFKSLSGTFRRDGITCSEYHDHCLQLVDIKTFEKFFPELLVLLPDIAKQQELYAIHVSKNPKSMLAVTPCGRCGQIVAKSELDEHKKSCSLDSDFPALSLR